MEGFLRVREVEGITVADAVVRLTVRGFNGQEIEVEAVVDTGFQGQLSLRAGDVILLGLAANGYLETVLADGSSQLVKTFQAVVEWDGVGRIVTVLGDDWEPLIGMGLLLNHNLSVDVEDGGTVRITKLAGV